MKEKLTFLKYNDIDYPLIFTLNVMEAIQDEYGSYDKWFDELKKEEPNIKALKFGLCEMLNEGIEIYNETSEKKLSPVDLKTAGRIITVLGFNKVAEKISENVVNSTKVDDIPKNE